MKRTRALVLAILTTFFWSGSYIVNKIAFAQGIGPMTLSGMRYTIGGITLFLLLKDSGQGTPLPLKYTLLQAVVCYGLGQGCQYIGQNLLSPTVASLLLNVGMVLCLLALDLLILHESAGQHVIAKVLLLVMGMVLYYRPWQGGLASIPLAGVLFMLLAAFGSAMNIFCNRYMLSTKGIERKSLTVRPMFCGGILMLTVGLITENFPRWTLPLTLCVLYLALISGALGFGLWVYSQQSLTAVQSGSINNAMLIEIALLDMIFFASRPDWIQWLSILIVFVAVTLLQVRQKKTEN